MNKNEKKLFSLAAFFILLFPGFLAQAEDAIVGKIAVVNGKVSIKSGSGAVKSANAGDKISNLDTVNTESGATVKLIFTDQSIIDLGPSSSFKVADYALKNTDNRTGTFSLLFGKMRSLVTKKVGEKGKVQFKAGNSVMGVRGTEFVVDAPKGADGVVAAPKLVVVSGLIAIGNINGGALVMVKQGEMMKASFSLTPGKDGSQSDSVQKVSAQEMQTVVASAKAEDKTFDAAVTIKSEKSEGVGSHGGNLAMNSMQNIVGDAITGQSNRAAAQEVHVAPPEFIHNNQSFLPPVNLVPGGLVHLSVGVIK